MESLGKHATFSVATQDPPAAMRHPQNREKTPRPRRERRLKTLSGKDRIWKSFPERVAINM
jgi:hypothetical protein